MNTSNEVNFPDEDPSSLLHFKEQDGVSTRPRVKREYRVHHGIFKWKIKWFSKTSLLLGKHLTSPVFELGETSWRIALNAKTENFGVKKMAFHFFRSSTDWGPATVNASYRLGLENAGNKVWFKAEEGKTFGNLDCCSFETSVLGHLEDFMDEDTQDDESRTLLVLCEIYVKHLANILQTVPHVLDDIELEPDLREQMLGLFKSDKYANVLIKGHNFHFPAHKAVLCARSRTLARMLENGTSVLKFGCSQACMNCALLFMYCGNFTYVAHDSVFSIGLYEFARELSLTKLCDLLIPETIELKSMIEVDRCEFDCRLPGFQFSDIVGKIRKTGTFNDEIYKIDVQLFLQKSDDPSSDVECRIALSGFEEALNFSFRLFLKNSDPDTVEMIPGAFSQDSPAECKDSIFYYNLIFATDDVLRCSSSGVLWFVLRCIRCSLKHWPQTTSMFKIPQTPLRYTSDWRENLSSDMCQLYESATHSDIVLESMGERFSAHRCILASRSGYFRETVAETGTRNEVVQITNLNPTVLNSMLIYIYSGHFDDAQDLAVEDILELYEAAKMYDVRLLAKESGDFLQMNLNPEFVHRVLAVAQNYNDEYLASECEDYLAVTRFP